MPWVLGADSASLQVRIGALPQQAELRGAVLCSPDAPAQDLDLLLQLRATHNGE